MLFLIFLLFTQHPSAATLTTTANLSSPRRLQIRDALVTRFETVWLSGDIAQSRTAEIGFDCRVDLDRSLWGFCPTGVFVASDCGLAGNCVDRHACSRGCGKGAGLTTFTCTGSNGEFCTTAELYLTNNIGPFSYIGCGGARTTDRYSAFTTTPTSKSTTGASLFTSTVPSTTPSSTQVISQTGISANATATPTPDPQVNTSNSTTGNTGAIIGGVVGCLALICSSAVATVWLLRRQRSKTNSKAPSTRDHPEPRSHPEPKDSYVETKQDHHTFDSFTRHEPYLKPDLLPVRELGALKSPVELPAARF